MKWGAPYSLHLLLVILLILLRVVVAIAVVEADIFAFFIRVIPSVLVVRHSRWDVAEGEGAVAAVVAVGRRVESALRLRYS